MTDREILIQYLLMKVRQEDWHGVNDAIKEVEDALAEPAIKESLTVRPWVGLTEDEIWTLHDSYLNPVEFARAIEAMLREKNT